MIISRLKLAIAVLILIAQPRPAWTQGFINLDFEHPILPLIPDAGFQVPITNALPGWKGYVAGTQVNQVAYNTVSIGAAAISFQETNGFISPLQGLYSVGLQSSDPGSQFFAAIAQTGQIPLTALSVSFFASQFATLQLFFGGQQLPLVQIGSGTGYDILATDISAFAGQIGELRFSSGIGPFGTGGGGFLDAIQFSSQAVPEPSSFGLLGVGGLFLGMRRTRKSKR